MAPSTQQPLLFFTLFFLLLHSSSSSSSSSSSPSSDLTRLIYKGCANQKFQDQSQTLDSLYNTLIAQSTTSNFYKTTTASITGLYQCRGDLSTADCNTCVQLIPQTIRKLCGGDTIAARVQLGGCYLRYEVAGFQQVPATELLFKRCGSGRASEPGFDERLAAALGQIAKGVSAGKGYYAGGYQSVYVLGQCEGDLGNGDCVNCVKSAAGNAVSECGSSISGHVYLQQCYISYTYYPNGVPASGGGGGVETGATESGGGDGGGGRNNTQKTVAIVIGGLAGLGLGVAFLLVVKSAFKKKKDKHSYGGY